MRRATGNLVAVRSHTTRIGHVVVTLDPGLLVAGTGCRAEQCTGTATNGCAGGGTVGNRSTNAGTECRTDDAVSNLRILCRLHMTLHLIGGELLAGRVICSKGIR